MKKLEVLVSIFLTTYITTRRFL